MYALTCITMPYEKEDTAKALKSTETARVEVGDSRGDR